MIEHKKKMHVLLWLWSSIAIEYQCAIDFDYIETCSIRSWLVGVIIPNPRCDHRVSSDRLWMEFENFDYVFFFFFVMAATKETWTRSFDNKE